MNVDVPQQNLPERGDYFLPDREDVIMAKELGNSDTRIIALCYSAVQEVDALMVNLLLGSGDPVLLRVSCKRGGNKKHGSSEVGK